MIIVFNICIDTDNIIYLLLILSVTNLRSGATLGIIQCSLYKIPFNYNQKKVDLHLRNKLVGAVFVVH